MTTRIPGGIVTSIKTGPKRLRKTGRDGKDARKSRKLWDGPPPKANKAPVMEPEDFTIDPEADTPVIPFGETEDERIERILFEEADRAEAAFVRAQDMGLIRYVGPKDAFDRHFDGLGPDEYEPECDYCGGPCNVRDFPL
jgi:hypothetical protein